MKMKNLIIGSLFILSIPFTVYAQQKDSVLKYPLLIKFQSICCGVPDDAPLRKSIAQFKKKYKIKSMVAYRISPMRKEGDYDLGFPLSKLNAAKRTIFINQMTAVSKLMNDKGNATPELNSNILVSELPKRISIEKISF